MTTLLLVLLLQAPPLPWPLAPDARFDSVATFALAHPPTTDPDLEWAHHQSFGREPYGDPIGPFRVRGGPAGLVIHRGRIVARWGDTERVDMTFSVTKSFLSLMAGVAWDRGLIDLDRPAHQQVAPIQVWKPEGSGTSLLELFDTPHNRTITWEHLLRQTSDWEGTLWGKPDWADRPARDIRTDRDRDRHASGSVYEYNDVRVNVLALALLDRFREPLPVVLKREIMDPIGASPTWRWFGYDPGWVVMDGRLMQAVGGGGHWGGGLFISAEDLARFGYLMLRNGEWDGRRLISAEWLRKSATPGPAQPGYGYMNWFLRPNGAITHLGNGTNVVYVNRELDLVMVARWVHNPELDALIGRLERAARR